MGLILLTPPVVEPVSLAEFKEFCRVDQDDTSQDNVLITLGMAARSWAEAFTRRRFVQQTWRQLLDCFPGYVSPNLELVLPYPPVQGIVAFQYQAANGNATAMALDTDYLQDLQSNPARLTPPFGKMWPVNRITPNAVQVDFRVGYAIPVTVSAGADPGQVVSSAYTFQASDVGRPISVPSAGIGGAPLNTIVAGIASPPSGTATLRDPLAGGLENQAALLVNAANGNPAHWELIKAGIKMLVERWYDIRVPDENNIPMAVKAVLSPVRDLRV